MRINITYRVILLSVLLTAVIGVPFTAYSAEVYSYSNKNALHPDGVLHKLSIDMQAAYLSVKKQPGENVIDIQKFETGLNWIISSKLVWKNSFKIVQEDSVLYQFQSAFRIYLKNPLGSEYVKNPDGPTGSPVLDLGAAVRYDDYSNSENKTFVQSKITLPVSTALSLLAGANLYDDLLLTDTDEYYGGISIYLSKYDATAPYENPDAPLSGASFQLTGGSSKNGTFFQTSCLLPSSKSLSLKVLLRADFLEAPYDKIYSGGLGFSYYPGK